MSKFTIKSQWIIYEDDVPQVHTVVRLDQEVVVTEYEGREFPWVPAVLDWLAESATEKSQ